MKKNSVLLLSNFRDLFHIQYTLKNDVRKGFA